MGQSITILLLIAFATQKHKCTKESERREVRKKETKCTCPDENEDRVERMKMRQYV